jgi:hypothetical protein
MTVRARTAPATAGAKVLEDQRRIRRVHRRRRGGAALGRHARWPARVWGCGAGGQHRFAGEQAHPPKQENLHLLPPGWFHHVTFQPFLLAAPAAAGSARIDAYMQPAECYFYEWYYY